MSDILNNKMLEAQKELSKLDKSTKGDYELWRKQIEYGHNVEPYEFEEALRYLDVLKEGNEK